MKNEEMRIEYVAIDDVVSWPRNPKKHATNGIRKSIARFGYNDPIAFDEASGRLVEGHGRVAALVRMRDAGEPAPERIRVDGDVWKVPVIRGISFASESEAEAYLVGHNKLTEAGGWDKDLLNDILVDLGEEFDFDVIGIDVGDMFADTSEDEVVHVDDADDPITGLGDIWILGEHVLICGDSTDPSVVDRIIADGEAEMVFTDPPYGIEYVGKTKDALTIENDSSIGLNALLDGAFGACMRIVRPGGAWYVCAPPGRESFHFLDKLLALDVFRQRLVWDKGRIVMGRSDFQYQHEDIYYGWTPGGKHRGVSDRTMSSVWSIPKPNRSAIHPTMKPIALCSRAISTSSGSGDVVFEPFGGSGSTLIACERLGRAARVVELSPAYCDAIVKRWENETGQRATLA